MAAKPSEVPLIVRLVEDPRFDLPWIDLFSGAVNLESHDRIHALLGRGLFPKDEAFFIGFTRGSTNRTTTGEQKLYGLVAKYLYPRPYRFSNEDIQVFKDACGWRIRHGHLKTITLRVQFLNATLPIRESISSAVAGIVE